MYLLSSWPAKCFSLGFRTVSLFKLKVFLSKILQVAVNKHFINNNHNIHHCVMNTIKCHIEAIAIKQRKPSVNRERQGTAPPGQSQSSPGNMQQLSYATKFPTLLHWWILSNSNTYLNNYNLHHTFFALRFGIYCLLHLWGLTRVNSDKRHGPISSDSA